MEPESDRNIKLSIEVRLSGNSSFYFFVGSWFPKVHNVQEGSNQPIQTEGWPRKFLLQLLSDLPLLFIIKTFSVVDKIYNFFFLKSLITVLRFFLCNNKY